MIIRRMTPLIYFPLIVKEHQIRMYIESELKLMWDLNVGSYADAVCKSKCNQQVCHPQILSRLQMVNKKKFVEVFIEQYTSYAGAMLITFYRDTS